MALIKKNSSDSQEWMNFQGSANFVANPDNGGGGDATLPQAQVKYEGILPVEIVTLDAYGDDVDVIRPNPAQVQYEGILPAAITASKVTITPPLAQVQYGGAGATPYHCVTAPQAEVEYEGATVIPAHGVVAPPAEVEYEGTAPPTLQGLSVSIPVIPAQVQYEGTAPRSIFNFLTAVYTVSIIPPLAQVYYEGIEDMDPYHYVLPPPAEVEYEGGSVIPAHGVIAPQAEVEYEGIAPRIKFEVGENIPKAKFYSCTLTGDADGVDDVLLKISSLSIRLRDGDPTYCGVVVPNANDNLSKITARPNGQIVIKRGYRFMDGSEVATEICRVDLEEYPYDLGINKTSIRPSGHITESNSFPQTIDIRPIQSFAVQADGARRVRSQVSFFLRPGDTVIYGDDAGESFVVGLITISVDTNMDRMEVTEVTS